MVGSADEVPVNVSSAMASDRVDSVPDEELAESAGLIMRPRLLQRRSSDLAAVDSRSPTPAAVQPAEPVPLALFDDGLEALLAAQMPCSRVHSIACTLVSNT